MMRISYLSESDLRKVDLNLLVALDVVLEERHVTRSAKRLDVTQPAMSRTLARLRTTFDDPLLVRTPEGYERTARADELRGPLKSVLGEIRRTLSKPKFDLFTATGTFKIATLDYAEVVILPHLMRSIRSQAPAIEIEIVQKPVLSISEILEGHADLSIGLMPTSTPKHCVVQSLFEDEHVCVMHREHPLAGLKLTINDYLKYPHSIIHTGSSSKNVIDDALQRLGYQRHIAKRTPHFVASLLSIGQTDLLQTVPRRLAEALLQSADLVISDLPFEVKPVLLSQLWHMSSQKNPLHTWLREQIALSVQSPSEA